VIGLRGYLLSVGSKSGCSGVMERLSVAVWDAEAARGKEDLVWVAAVLLSSR
jgi:hypothetical protein